MSEPATGYTHCRAVCKSIWRKNPAGWGVAREMAFYSRGRDSDLAELGLGAMGFWVDLGFWVLVGGGSGWLDLYLMFNE